MAQTANGDGRFNADIREVKITKAADGSYSFEVTVVHADEGWQHYADKWDIVAPDGSLLGSRTLYHPHVNEHPFTRSLPKVEIPAGISQVTVLAHDSTHGYSGKELSVALPSR